MNNTTLLKKKRNRKNSENRDGDLFNAHLNTSIVQFNGFNIVELYNEENHESNTINTNNNLINKNNNSSEMKEISKKRARNIEQYYSIKHGIVQINENCFKCLMNNFLSNELLYFNSRESLFNYIKYCYMTKKKIIFINEENYEENKQSFNCVNKSFLNGWRFFIPKTICKGCFMEIINIKNLIYKIKDIFIDIEGNSSCKTNYRNYVLFSQGFRTAFSIRSRVRNPRKKKFRKKKNEVKEIIVNNHFKKIINTNNKGKKKIYNMGVKYEKNINVLTIFKKVLDNSLINDLKNNLYKDNKSDNNNLISSDFKCCEIINLKKDDNTINAIINEKLFDNNLININILNVQLKELLNKISNNYIKVFISLNNVKEKIYLVNSFMLITIQKIHHFILYPCLIKRTKIITYYKSLYYSFDDGKKDYEKYLAQAKTSSEDATLFLNNILNVINLNMNIKEKNSIIAKIEELKSLVDKNNKFLDEYNLPLKNFIHNFKFLYKSMREFLSS